MNSLVCLLILKSVPGVQKSSHAAVVSNSPNSQQHVRQLITPIGLYFQERKFVYGTIHRNQPKITSPTDIISSIGFILAMLPNPDPSGSIWIVGALKVRLVLMMSRASFKSPLYLISIPGNSLLHFWPISLSRPNLGWQVSNTLCKKILLRKMQSSLKIIIYLHIGVVDTRANFGSTSNKPFQGTQAIKNEIGRAHV